jgi:hypothetical protein
MTGNNGELTDFEKTKLENFMLKHNALQQQMQANLNARQIFITVLLDAHPGYAWDESAGLVPLPIE